MAENNNDKELVRQIAEQKYEFGFTTDVHTEIIEQGLNENVVRLISKKKGEPDWMLDFRLRAFRYWQQQSEPTWGHLTLPPIDYQAISYYADPTAKNGNGNGTLPLPFPLPTIPQDRRWLFYFRLPYIEDQLYYQY